MKSRRILAAVLASVCAFSAMTAVASAADEETVDSSTPTNVVEDDNTPADDDTNGETPADGGTNGETPADGDTSGEAPADGDTNGEASADDDTSSGDTEPAAPGETDKTPVVIEANIKNVDSKNGIEGAALNALLLVQDGKKYTWADVEKVEFSSDKLFSVQFATTEDAAGTTWFTMGKDKASDAKDDTEAPEWGLEWTIGENELAMFDTGKDDKGLVKIIAKEDGTNINAKVTLNANAQGTPVDGGNNQNTGIAMAIAPVVLAGAAAAVVAVSKKRK